MAAGVAGGHGGAPLVRGDDGLSHSRNLHLLSRWALRGYGKSWHTTRELQVQRGMLNRTVRALADANLLLKRTTYDLADARAEAERARQPESHFAASISDELRTPLHLIVGFSQMMYTSPESYDGAAFTPEPRGDVQEVCEGTLYLSPFAHDPKALHWCGTGRSHRGTTVALGS